MPEERRNRFGYSAPQAASSCPVPNCLPTTGGGGQGGTGFKPGANGDLGKQGIDGSDTAPMDHPVAQVSAADAEEFVVDTDEE